MNSPDVLDHVAARVREFDLMTADHHLSPADPKTYIFYSLLMAKELKDVAVIQTSALTIKTFSKQNKRVSCCASHDYRNSTCYGFLF